MARSMTPLADARSALAKLRPPAGADEHVWAARITACWRASVEAIFEVGRLLAAAKEVLPHGKFGAMIESDLPFSSSTAQRLMTIAADARLSNPAHVQHLPPSWGTLYELTKLPDDEFDRKIKDGTIRPDMMRRDLVETKPVEPPAQTAPPPRPEQPHSPSVEPPTIEHDPAEVPGPPEPQDDQGAPLPGGNRSIMASRKEPDDSLDFFPTPPWGTRALFEHVLPHLGVTDVASAWDPACGEGHMTAVMEEYVRGPVIGTDIFDYSDGECAPPAWLRLQDFLDETAETPVVDMIISNPPFGKLTEAFVLRSLELAEVGVAMFVRLQWLETIGRYNAIFRDRPPTLLALFCERVNLCKGRWEPDGSTATAYMWLAWLRDRAPMPPLWIPPGRRVDLWREDDRERFTAHPVIGKPRAAPDNVIGLGDGTSIPDDVGVGVVDEEFDPETGELSPVTAGETAQQAASRKAPLESSGSPVATEGLVSCRDRYVRGHATVNADQREHGQQTALSEGAEMHLPKAAVGVTAGETAPNPSAEHAILWHPSQGEYEGHVKLVNFDHNAGTIDLITNGYPIHPELIDDAIADRSRIFPDVKNWTVTVDGKPVGEPTVTTQAESSVNSKGGNHEVAQDHNASTELEESEVVVVPQPSPASDSEDEGIPTFLRRGHPDCIVKSEGGS